VLILFLCVLYLFIRSGLVCLLYFCIIVYFGCFVLCCICIFVIFSISLILFILVVLYCVVFVYSWRFLFYFHIIFEFGCFFIVLYLCRLLCFLNSCISTFFFTFALLSQHLPNQELNRSESKEIEVRLPRSLYLCSYCLLTKFHIPSLKCSSVNLHTVIRSAALTPIWDTSVTT
jgi:hypothetical protein